MSPREPDKIAFAGSIPVAYDNHLGPFLFDFYAADLAARVEFLPGCKILETACGTGIATEHLHAACDERGEILATDLSNAMLARARDRRGHLEGVRFEQGDAVQLALEDDSFDVAVSQFGLMFIPDKLQALRESHRLLRPGGQLVFSVWDTFDSNPYVRIAQDTIATFFDGDAPTFLELPWSFSAVAPIHSLLQAAGFTEVEVNVVAHMSECPSAQDVAEGLVCGNPTLIAIEDRANATCIEIVAAVARELGAVFGSAPFRAPTQALVITARRPGRPPNA